MPFYERDNVRIRYEESGPGSRRAAHTPTPPTAIHASATKGARKPSTTRPAPTADRVEAPPRTLSRSPADFVYSVDRDFVRGCQVPILVMPDDSPAHSYD